MNLYELRKISKKKHIGEITPNNLITDIGLYDSLLVETINVCFNDHIIEDGNEPNVISSPDVNALHNFVFSYKPIMLPCPYCERMQAYRSDYGYRNLNIFHQNWKQMIMNNKLYEIPFSEQKYEECLDDEKSVDLEKLFEEKREYIELANRLHYSFADNKIYTNSYNIFDQTLDFSRIKTIIAKKTMVGIMESIDELRKDYVCGYDESHNLFVDFSFQPAIDVIPEELLEYKKRLRENSKSEMTEREQEAYRLYNSLKYCLIMKKIAQYPSMADMQFSDRVKYKPILKNQYNDYIMALGLFADGVGAGAFVYLRRIMESIVEEFHQECISLNTWNDEEYSKKRFNEKIDYIEQFGKIVIPTELKEVRKELYGVLSMGIHTAPEEECKMLFPYLKFAIDTFLAQKVEEKEREKRVEEMNREIRNVKKR